MAARWLPNLEEFFDSFWRVLTDDINNLNSEDDRSDYFSRRIEDYERTLRILAARLVEAVPHNMSQLLDITATTRIQLEDRAIHRENRDFPHVLDGFFQSSVEHSW